VTRRRVAVLFGGRSAEHEVSLASARSVIEALEQGGHMAMAIGIDKRGRWHWLEELPESSSSGELPSVASDSGKEVSLSTDPGEMAMVAEEGSRGEIDVVFPVLHGPFGEDGTIQGMLELAGVPYVGAGVLASSVGMDKAVQKILFAAAGLPVVEHEVAHEREWEVDRQGVLARAERLGFPLFVKPSGLGSSVGITRVKSADAMVAAVEEALSYGRKVLLERAVDGREIECAVIGNDDPQASLPCEIITDREFYDYRAKYIDTDGTMFEVPATLRGNVTDEIRRMAVTAFRAIDATGMARVDFFYREPDDIRVNEINTIPGFTSVSMYPKMWEVSGLSYPRLVERLVELAIERHRMEAKRGRTLP
jgi:D-alanine-D-alanine ligase